MRSTQRLMAVGAPGPVASGFTLIEVLIAVTLSSGLLLAAWGWTWTISRACSRADDRQELCSGLSFAQRVITADIRDAQRLVTGSDVGCTSSSLCLALVDSEGQLREVPIVYDATRGLLWRLTSSCHLIDGLLECRFRYLGEDGAPVSSPLTAQQASAVRQVAVSVCLQRGASRMESAWSVTIGGGEL